MNRPKAHHIFVIASIYLLGIIIIMFLFILPQLKERFAKSPSLAEEYPMLVSNYSDYPLDQRIIWVDQPGITIPVIAAEKYDLHYIYAGDMQTDVILDYELGVFVGKKNYVIYHQIDPLSKPELFGPFKI